MAKYQLPPNRYNTGLLNPSSKGIPTHLANMRLLGPSSNRFKYLGKMKLSIALAPNRLALHDSFTSGGKVEKRACHILSRSIQPDSDPLNLLELRSTHKLALHALFSLQLGLDPLGPLVSHSVHRLCSAR